MTDFSHLKKLDVTEEKTVEYPIYQINGEPTLILKPATEANKPYFNAVLKRSKRNIRAVKGGINRKIIDDNRDEDKELYPKYVIAGWYDQIDAKGKKVEFSVKNCTDFIKALPNWIFDDIRAYASESSNYFESIDIETKLGN